MWTLFTRRADARGRATGCGSEELSKEQALASEQSEVKGPLTVSAIAGGRPSAGMPPNNSGYQLDSAQSFCHKAYISERVVEG